VIKNNGNVGIGTTTPKYNLSIEGTTNDLFQIATTTNQGIFVVKSDGNVGIGTTSPGAKLDLYGSAGDYLFSLGEPHTPESVGVMLSMAASGNFPFEMISASDNPSFRPIINWFRARGGVENYTSLVDGDWLGSFQGKGYDGSGWVDAVRLTFAVDGTPSTGIVPGRVQFEIQDTGGTTATRLVIKNNGNVGIGTTTPNYNLVINGTTGNLLQVATSTNQGIMVINSNGNVGIGMTTPGVKLDVAGSMKLAGAMNLDNPGASTFIEMGHNTADYNYIDFHGSPTYTDFGGRIIRYNTGDNAIFEMLSRGTGGLKFRTLEAGPIDFYTANLFAMRIASNGNVGIGNTAPSYKLDVYPASGFTGDLLRVASSTTGAGLGRARD
jgi:hypothetical protein